MPEISTRVTCRKCHRAFAPNFIDDFYPDGKDPNVGLCERCMMAEAMKPKPEPVPIPATHREKVCGFGTKKEATCAFIGFTGGDLMCLKGSNFEDNIRGRLAQGSMVAKGDNCSGPPDFKPTVKVE